MNLASKSDKHCVEFFTFWTPLLKGRLSMACIPIYATVLHAITSWTVEICMLRLEAYLYTVKQCDHIHKKQHHLKTQVLSSILK